MDKEIIKQSVALQAKADQIINMYGLLAMLKKYGEVRTIGSYHYKVMTTPDIDLHILNTKATKETALSIFNTLMQLEGVVSSKVTDFVEYRKELAHNPDNLPPLSYFIGAKIWYEEQLWKIDVSLLKEKQDEVDEYEEYFNQIDESTRTKIILLKDRARKDKNVNIYSKDIYRAFMHSDIHEYDDLIKYMSNRDY